MKYNVLQFVTNTKDQYSASVVATYNDENGAKVKYHQLLAALHNAPDAKLATVTIVDEYGHQKPDFFEVVDHTATIVEDAPAEETEAV